MCVGFSLCPFEMYMSGKSVVLTIINQLMTQKFSAVYVLMHFSYFLSFLLALTASILHDFQIRKRISYIHKIRLNAFAHVYVLDHTNRFCGFSVGVNSVNSLQGYISFLWFLLFSLYGLFFPPT